MTAQITKTIILLSMVVVGFVLGRWLSPRCEAISTTIIVDTTIHYRPIAVSNSIEYRDIVLPRLLFVPGDTTTTEVIIEAPNEDEVKVSVPIERREYRDSTYRAVVSGAVVGDVHPTLEELEVYQRTTNTIVAAKVPMFRPYIGASAGIYGGTSFTFEAGCLIKGHHLPKVGYINNQGKNIVEVGYGYIF